MPDTQLTPSSARASATYSTFGPSKAIDGDTGTNWSATSNAYHWLEVDLGSVQAFSMIRFYQGAAGEEYDFWTSPDGFQWDKVAGSTAVADDDWTDVQFHPVQARYVLARHTVGNDWANCAEIQIWMEASYTAYTPGTRIRRYLAGADFLNTATATASSTYTGADPYEPIELEGYEQSGTTEKWLSNGAAEGQWLKLDLGQSVTITRVLVHSGNNGNVDFTVETSSDGTNWSAFDTAKTGISNRLTPLTFTDDAVSARYVRVTGGNVSGGDWMEVTGFYVETDAAIVEYGASPPPSAGTWVLPDGCEWELNVTLFRRVASAADGYGTAAYGGARYGGYSTTDDEDVSAYAMGLQTFRGMNHFRETMRAGRATILLDNTDGQFSDTTNHYTKPGDWVRIYMGYDDGGGLDVGWLFFGRIDQAREVMTPVGMEALQIVAYDAFPDLAALTRVDTPTVGAGEIAQDRIRRLVAEASECVGRVIIHDTGEFVDPTMQATNMTANRLQELLATIATEGGQFWIRPVPTTPTGGHPMPDAVQAGRDWPSSTRSSTSQASLGGAGIGITDATPSRERSRVVNVAEIGNVGGVVQVAQDETPALVAQYGRRTYSRTDLLGDSDANALTLAQDLVAALKDAGDKPAIRSVTMPVVDCASLAAACELELLDMVDYDVEGLSGWTSGLTGDSHVIGIAHTIAASDWTVVLTLDDTYA